MDDDSNFGCGVSLALLFFILVIGGIVSYASYNTVNHYTITVSGKERQCDTTDKGSNCYYVVFGTNGEFFSNEDSMFNGKWNSASLQARLQVGHRYVVKTNGWRVPFLSIKPNIITAEEVK